jgi:pyruvate kinase
MSSRRNTQDGKAKIICTIGPASSHKAVLSSLIEGGMDIARLNFSHGDHDTHKRYMKMIRELSRTHRKPVAIMQDLQGIKIRVGRLEKGAIELKKDNIVTIMPGAGVGNSRMFYISYPPLTRDVRKGDRILLDDGLIQLAVISVKKNTVAAKVREGGVLGERKGVNLPGVALSVRSFTEKDKRDLLFGMDNDVDYVALSFVRDVNDIRLVKRWLSRRKHQIPLIAKIEKPEALNNIEDILSEVEGIMVARGDLGVEMPSEEIPLIQKELIERANRKGKIVITATQMLESMTEHMRPTRAETTDVANAVLDGTDAVMLSAETATGKYPVHAVKMMDRIIRYTESIQHGPSSYIRGNTVADAVADAACRAAEDMRIKILVAFTRSGFTARLVSKLRPQVPIIAYTPHEKVQKRMCLYWGVTSKVMRPLTTTDEMVKEVEKSLVREKIVNKCDRIIIISSSPLSTMKKTNFMKIHRIGD